MVIESVIYVEQSMDNFYITINDEELRSLIMASESFVAELKLNEQDGLLLSIQDNLESILENKFYPLLKKWLEE